MGDAGGIGPEIIAKVLESGNATDICTPVIIGDHNILDQEIKNLGLDITYKIITSDSKIDKNSEIIQFYHIPHPDIDKIEKGKVSPICGLGDINMIHTAVDLVKKGFIDGICYGPLNKASMIAADSSITSEMGLFAKSLNANGSYGEINMVDNVWTTRVTSHIPLKDVSANLSVQNVLESIKLAQKTLLQSGYKNPRIGVAGLNPHCGESGLCGDEEITIISPAVEKAVELGINATGPYPSDILFIKAFDGLLNAGVTMFHDQGQIALKLKGFDKGITIAGGLDIPITTCAHGTGFDIVGKNIASTSSFINALTVVNKMAGKEF